ncbi:MAG: TDP-N-acetylfucosamine:lipid II N-acetylfucosaminyltransferase [Helicobacter sp.]|nr:TDP-N-acetylfucosamine:lipid II N-acetylfucosaminyltransferase [Helicobacter sp.]
MNFLHILSSSLHSVKFVEFMQEYFDLNNHKFIYVRPDICKYGLSKFSFIKHLKEENKQELLELMCQADKIILHGLWRYEVINTLYENAKLLQKCCWILWGGDFCLGKNHYSKEHNFVMENMGEFVQIAGDYAYIVKEYNIKGSVITFSSFYTANIFNSNLSIANNVNNTKILLGNSADPLNNHLEILEALKSYKQENIEIICPLSYGANDEYIKKIKFHAKNIFKDKFKPLLELIPYKEYLEILKSIDIAIFAHKNQQAYGNIIQLLGMGKKVYMRKTTSFLELIQNGAILFDFDNGISLEKLDKNKAKENFEKISSIYSLENTLHDHRRLYKLFK